MGPDSKGLGLLLLSCLVYLESCAAELTIGVCRDLGFDKNTLLCSSCDSLAEKNLSDLSTDCQACCIQDNVNAQVVKHPRATLEVCGWRLGAYPQVQAFVKSDRPKAFPNLVVKYVRGADPVIKLQDEAGSVMETLAIDRWNTDSVEEFLGLHLSNPQDDFADIDAE